MKIILAQGNPGEKYAETRHNVGWRFLTAYAARNNSRFVKKTKFTAEIAEFTAPNGEKVLLVKPLTYYNDTGLTARQLIDFYKLTSRDVLVVHDELALPLGTLRTREQGSHAGNNGIKSLIAHIGPDFARLRIGIQTPRTGTMDTTAFVLDYFSAEDYAILDRHTEQIMNIFDDFIDGELEITSHVIPQTS